MAAKTCFAAQSFSHLGSQRGACSRTTSRWQSYPARQRRDVDVFGSSPAWQVRAHPYSLHITMAALWTPGFPLSFIRHSYSLKLNLLFFCFPHHSGQYPHHHFPLAHDVHTDTFPASVIISSWFNAVIGPLLTQYTFISI